MTAVVPDRWEAVTVSWACRSARRGGGWCDPYRQSGDRGKRDRPWSWNGNAGQGDPSSEVKTQEHVRCRASSATTWGCVYRPCTRAQGCIGRLTA